MAMDQQMRLAGRFADYTAAEFEQSLDVVGLRRIISRDMLFDDVMEAQFQLCVLAEAAERVWFGRGGIQN